MIKLLISCCQSCFILKFSGLFYYFLLLFDLSKEMDQNLLNFWKNYENIINWGYRTSGARGSDSESSFVTIDTETKEINTCTTFNTEIDEYDDDVCSSDGSVDIDLEYLNFSKKTLEHQEKIELEKRKVDKEYGFCNSPSFENESTSITEVNVINPTKLYGSKVNEIECLENNLQSEFEKFCATKKPVLWPGMAFNWDVPEPELHLDPKTQSHPFLG